MMDRVRRGNRQAVLESVGRVLEQYLPLDPEEAITPADAFFAYRLLLRRLPEAGAELAAMLADDRPAGAFLAALIGSPEFANTGGLLPPGHLLMADLAAFRFWFNTADREMGVRMGLGLYEPESVALLRRLVRPGMRCLDIGAQTGFYTCLMATLVGPSGRVDSFEPLPASHELLARNVRENGFDKLVHLHQAACSDAAGVLRGSLVSGMYVVGEVADAEPLAVPMVRVDDVVHHPVDLVKIDIEGHEPAALRGMRDRITRDRPLILTEANAYWLRAGSGTTVRQYLQAVCELGYTVYDLEAFDAPLDLGALELDSVSTRNILAVPAEEGEGTATAESCLATSRAGVRTAP